MRKGLFIVIAIIGFVCSAFSQDVDYVVKPGGATLTDYLPISSSQHFVGEIGDNIMMYHSSINANPQYNQNRLITYDLGTRDAKIEKLILPVGEEPIFTTFDYDGNVMAYYKNTAKAKQLLFSQATIAPSSNPKAEKKVKPEVLLTQIIEPKDQVLHFAAESPDKNSFAIVLVVTNQNNELKNYIVYVFNKNGEILWNQTFENNFNNNYFNVHDFALTNQHKVLFLISSAKSVKNKLSAPAMHLVSLYKMDQVNMENVTPFGYITSMKMLILSTGEYFVSGYFEEKPRTFSTGYFSAVYDVRLEEQKRIQTTPFNLDFKARTDDRFDEFSTRPNQFYDMSCKQLFELDNGFVAMIGEQFAAVPYTDAKKGITTYTNISKGILYNLFAIDSDGERAGSDVVLRAQMKESEYPVTYRNDAIRYPSIYYNKATGNVTSVHTVPAAAEGLSFGSFAIGNAVYLLYNDNILNFTEPMDVYQTTNLTKPNDVCMVLARINRAGNVDKKILMPADKMLNIYNQMWHFDGSNIIFSYSDKKDVYRLQHFKMSDQWDWDM